jgi:hypothetical protein
MKSMVNKIILLIMLVAMPVAAQPSAPNHLDEATNLSPVQLENQTNLDQTTAVLQDNKRARAICIEGRRLVCGKILEVLPDGLVLTKYFR